jgi:hypothetical protein
MDAPMNLMVHHFLLEKTQQVLLFGQDCHLEPCSHKNPSGHDKYNDKHDIYPCPTIIMERTDKILALSASEYSLVVDC